MPRKKMEEPPPPSLKDVDLRLLFLYPPSSPKHIRLVKEINTRYQAYLGKDKVVKLKVGDNKPVGIDNLELFFAYKAWMQKNYARIINGKVELSLTWEAAYTPQKKQKT